MKYGVNSLYILFLILWNLNKQQQEQSKETSSPTSRIWPQAKKCQTKYTVMFPTKSVEDEEKKKEI